MVFIPVPGTELLKPLDFTVGRDIKVLFVNETKLLGNLRMGPGCLLVPFTDLQGGKKGGGLSSKSAASDLLNHACVVKPPQSPKVLGSEDL